MAGTGGGGGGGVLMMSCYIGPSLPCGTLCAFDIKKAHKNTFAGIVVSMEEEQIVKVPLSDFVMATLATTVDYLSYAQSRISSASSVELAVGGFTLFAGDLLVSLSSLFFSVTILLYSLYKTSVYSTSKFR